MYRICISPEYTGAIMEGVIAKEYFQDVSDCYDDILNLFAEDAVRRNSIEFIEAEIFNEGGDDKEHTGLNGMVAKLGKMIKTLIEKVKQMFEKIFGSFSKEEREYKATVDKLNKEFKNNPALKQQALEGLQSGMLSPADFKNMNDFEKEFKKLMADKDPKSWRGKWNRLKDKFDNVDKSTVVKVASATTAVLGAGVAIAKFGPQISQAMRESKKNQQENEKDLSVLYDALNDAGQDPEKMGFIKEKVLAYQWKHGKEAQFYSTLSNNYGRLNGALKKLLTFDDKHQEKHPRKSPSMGAAADAKFGQYQKEKFDLQKKIKEATSEEDKQKLNIALTEVERKISGMAKK